MLPVAASSAAMGIGSAAGGSSILSSLGTAGSFLSGAGNFLGGLGGLFGKKKKAPNFQEQMWMNQQMEGAMLEARIGKMRELGFHDLVAAGINPATGGGYSVFNDAGPDKAEAIAGMGQGLSRAAHAWMAPEQRDYEIMSMNLGLENQALQNERLRSEIGLMRQPGTPPGLSLNSMGPDVVKVPKEVHGGISGLESGTRHALQEMLFPGLGKIRTKSEALGESMEDSILGSLMVDLLYTIPDLGVASVKQLPSALRDVFGYGLEKWSKAARRSYR